MQTILKIILLLTSNSLKGYSLQKRNNDDKIDRRSLWEKLQEQKRIKEELYDDEHKLSK